MTLEQRRLERLERPLDRVRLFDDVDAVLVFLDHLADALEMALNGGQAVQDLFFVALHGLALTLLVRATHPRGEGVAKHCTGRALHVSTPSPPGREQRSAPLAG